MDTTVETNTIDNLIAGIKHRVTETRLDLAASSGALSRGTVMGVVTSSGELAPYASDATDGTEVFYGILAQDVANKAAVQSVVVYLTGQFAEGSVIFAGAGDIAGIRADARTKGVFFEKTYDNDSN